MKIIQNLLNFRVLFIAYFPFIDCFVCLKNTVFIWICARS